MYKNNQESFCNGNNLQTRNFFEDGSNIAMNFSESSYQNNATELFLNGKNNVSAPSIQLMSTSDAVFHPDSVNTPFALPTTVINPSQNTMPFSRMKTLKSADSRLHSFVFSTLAGQNLYNMMPIYLSKCVLYPPDFSTHLVPGKKPLGCKTVLVKGLPMKATEEIMKEVFETCGTVEAVKMGSRDFCYIRFTNEMFVENAIHFSGFILKIENRDDISYTGRLVVSYQQNKKDLDEYVSKQELCHQEQENNKPATLPVVFFSHHESSLVCEKLKNDETFFEATKILNLWLTKGECTKKYADSFYSMIHSIHKQVLNLHTEKDKSEKQLNDAKMLWKRQCEKITHKFSETQKIYEAASLQKCWDHFSKAQRRNIEMWKKQAEAFKKAHVEKAIKNREDVEMDLSEDETEEKDNSDRNGGLEQKKCQLEDDIDKLRNENESLRSQLESARLSLYKRQQKEEKKQNPVKIRKKDNGQPKDNSLTFDKDYANPKSFPDSTTMSSEYEVRLISLLSVFLHVHPCGANVDYICSYLHQIGFNIKSTDLEKFMREFSTVFREDITGVGASLGKRWFLLSFKA